MDPCEKGSVDAAAGLTAQERADLTLIAQVIRLHCDTLLLLLELSPLALSPANCF